jgi:hypothetical protein
MRRATRRPGSIQSEMILRPHSAPRELSPARGSRLVAAALGLGLLALPAGAAPGSAPGSARATGHAAAPRALPILAQPIFAPQGGRADQVFERRGRNVRPVAGTVVSDTLEEVVIEVDGKERRIKSADVVDVQLNRVPDSHREGLALAEGGDRAGAAAAFRTAAADDEATAASRAKSQLELVRVLLDQVASDPTQAAQARAAAEEFARLFADSRHLPQVRLLLGRAQWLAGDAATAVATFDALAREASGATATTGYDVVVCFRAGLLGAEAALAAGQVTKAQELYGFLDSNIPAAQGALDPADPRQGELTVLRGATQLGEGHVLLAKDRGTQARSFFVARLDGGQDGPGVRLLAELGAARANQAMGEHRQAQLGYAQVSATAFGDDDVLAAALLGLAQTTLTLGDPGARDQARLWLEQIRSELGGTLAAPQAHGTLADL